MKIELDLGDNPYALGLIEIALSEKAIELHTCIRNSQSPPVPFKETCFGATLEQHMKFYNDSVNDLKTVDSLLDQLAACTKRV